MNGRWIRDWRTARGLSQAELGALLRPRVKQPTVARWESGARRTPPGLWQALERLEQVLLASKKRVQAQHPDPPSWSSGPGTKLDSALTELIEAYRPIATVDMWDPRGGVPRWHAIATATNRLKSALLRLAESGIDGAEGLRHEVEVLSAEEKARWHAPAGTTAPDNPRLQAKHSVEPLGDVRTYPPLRSK